MVSLTSECMPDLPEIPGYAVKRQLGSGGFATAYLAESTSLRRREVLKVMHAQLAEDEQFRMRFLREAQLVANLTHPHIVTVHAVNGEVAYPYIAMEYCEGGDLGQRINSGLTDEQVETTMLQLSGALEYAHSHSIVHRDIKPENVLFRGVDDAVLSDFGIAKALESTTHLTATGLTIGTPHYMSPEQIRGEDLDGRADFYSLGVMLYQMLVGEVPFHATSATAVMYGHLEKAVPQLPAERAHWQPLVDALLAKVPEERPASVTAVQALLPRNTVHDQPRARSTPSSAERSTVEEPGEEVAQPVSRWWVGALVLAALVVVAWFVAPNPNSIGTEPVGPVSPTLTEENGPTQPAVQPEVVEQPPQTWPLTVFAEPRNARIRVMNIAEVYRPGMLLPAGTYRIEVSRPGYQTVSAVISHRNSESMRNISLTPAYAGDWQGVYLFDQAGREQMKVAVRFALRGAQLIGQTRESTPQANTGFAVGSLNRKPPELTTTIAGQVDRSQLTFTTTYDQAGRDQVVHRGTYDDATRQIQGTWSSADGATGTFRLVRVQDS